MYWCTSTVAREQTVQMAENSRESAFCQVPKNRSEKEIIERCDPRTLCHSMRACGDSLTLPQISL
jgi:hypothetical protein